MSGSHERMDGASGEEDMNSVVASEFIRPSMFVII